MATDMTLAFGVSLPAQARAWAKQIRITALREYPLTVDSPVSIDRTDISIDDLTYFDAVSVVADATRATRTRAFAASLASARPLFGRANRREVESAIVPRVRSGANPVTRVRRYSVSAQRTRIFAARLEPTP